MASTDDTLSELIDNYNLLLDDINRYVQIFISKTKVLNVKSRFRKVVLLTVNDVTEISDSQN